MGKYVANEFIKQMKKKQANIKKSKILIMGLTFKENCADIRNSGVKEVYQELKKYKCKIDLYDPWVNSKEVKKEFGTSPILKFSKNLYDGVMNQVDFKL
jgi:UDP-N-acetyl-D-mannosaminuronate dehydrogenase